MLQLWLEKYAEIANIMGYDIARDRKATEMLASILRSHHIDPPLSNLRELLFEKPSIIFGAGPSLDEKTDDLLRIFPKISERFTLVTADGATQALIERGEIPQIVVTDLDGDVGSLLYSAGKGSLLVVHAHGDNMEKIATYIRDIISSTKLIIGTTQVEPMSPLQNFGGFTDGDRAVFMASKYNAAPIILVGMDFGKIVGKRSKPWLRRNVAAWNDKIKKLEIAYRLISWLTANSNVEIYTTSEIAPPGTRRIYLEEISQIVRCHS